MGTYAQERAKDLHYLTRDVLRELPDVCADFLRAIEPTTQPLTRYAYACDLKLFFHYLVTECPRFADVAIVDMTPKDLGRVTTRDLHMYLEYLGLYIKNDAEITNAELGKMRKLSSLRSFYKYMFKNMLIEKDVAQLIDMPKRHEKPIIRLEIDEDARPGGVRRGHVGAPEEL